MQKMYNLANLMRPHQTVWQCLQIQKPHLEHAVLNANPEGFPRLLQLDVRQVSFPLQAIVPLLLLQQVALQLCHVLLLLLQLSMHSSGSVSLKGAVLQLCPETAARPF